ncbi:MAG TPA: hypothetical protein VEC36_00710 [Patescibacteria group bacterium]|nr:hypothetical protein [Patescibacteria group bacterium]
MNFPLNLNFKIVALAPQISVTDANGQLMMYVKQKLFKLKEAITVYADEAQTQPLYYINANKILDFSAAYSFTDSNGQPIGSVRRSGMKSFWKAHYEIYNHADIHIFTIREANPWVKVLDTLVSDIPIINLFTGYFLHPSYHITRQSEVPELIVQKQAAFFEGKFTIEEQGTLAGIEEIPALLGILMMVLLERNRG